MLSFISLNPFKILPLLKISRSLSLYAIYTFLSSYSYISSLTHYVYFCKNWKIPYKLEILLLHLPSYYIYRFTYSYTCSHVISMRMTGITASITYIYSNTVSSMSSNNIIVELFLSVIYMKTNLLLPR